MTLNDINLRGSPSGLELPFGLPLQRRWQQRLPRYTGHPVIEIILFIIFSFSVDALGDTEAPEWPGAWPRPSLGPPIVR